MHIDFIVSKANRTLGYFRKNLYMASSDVRFLAYKPYIRSTVEYAGIIWNPWQDYLIIKLESVQNGAVRFIFRDYSCSSSVTALMSKACLSSLWSRRKVSSLSFLHRVFYHDSDLKNVILLPPYRSFFRLDHQQKIGLPSSCTKMYSEFPLNLAIGEWTNLAESVVSSPDCV